MPILAIKGAINEIIMLLMVILICLFVFVIAFFTVFILVITVMAFTLPIFNKTRKQIPLPSNEKVRSGIRVSQTQVRKSHGRQ